MDRFSAGVLFSIDGLRAALADLPVRAARRAAVMASVLPWVDLAEHRAHVARCIPPAPRLAADLRVRVLVLVHVPAWVHVPASASVRGRAARLVCCHLAVARRLVRSGQGRMLAVDGSSIRRPRKAR